MTLVQQITPFTCGLACIESLTVDFGVGITQCEMLVRYKELLKSEAPRPGDFGAITSLGISKILEDRGLSGVTFSSEKQDGLVDALTSNPNGIIWHEIQKGNNHFFRVSDYQDGKVFIMNPQFDLPRPKSGWVDLSDFVEGNSQFLLLSRPTT